MSSYASYSHRLKLRPFYKNSIRGNFFKMFIACTICVFKNNVNLHSALLMFRRQHYEWHGYIRTLPITPSLAHARKPARTHARAHARTHAPASERGHAHAHTHARAHSHTHTHTRARARTHARTHTRARARIPIRTGQKPQGIQRMN
jgi:urease accessory protein